MKKVIAAAIVWPAATFIAGSLWLYSGPIVEGKLAPVLTDQAISEVQREGNRVCWTWHFHKNRPAAVETIAFSFVVDGITLRVPAVVTRRGERDLIASSLKTRPTGPGERELRAVVPDDFVGLRDLRITGATEYRTSHHFWTIWQPAPDVEVPPL